MSRRRRVHLFFATLFYGFIGLAGAIWINFAAPRKVGELLASRELMQDIGIGIGAGLAIAVMTRVIVRLFAFARSLEQEFGWLLGNQTIEEIAFLALLSGVAEEIVFRGALQQMYGFAAATVVFALAHPPFNPRLMAWPFFAAAVGAVLALEFKLTGNLIAPILTHAVVNFINLLWISFKYKLLPS